MQEDVAPSAEEEDQHRPSGRPSGPPAASQTQTGDNKMTPPPKPFHTAGPKLRVSPNNNGLPDATSSRPVDIVSPRLPPSVPEQTVVGGDAIAHSASPGQSEELAEGRSILSSGGDAELRGLSPRIQLSSSHFDRVYLDGEMPFVGSRGEGLLFSARGRRRGVESLRDVCPEMDALFERGAEATTLEDAKQCLAEMRLWARYCLGHLTYEQEKTEHTEAVLRETAAARERAQREAFASSMARQRAEQELRDVSSQLKRMQRERDLFLETKGGLEERLRSAELGTQPTSEAVVALTQKSRAVEDALAKCENELAMAKVELATYKGERSNIIKLLRVYESHILSCDPSLFVDISDAATLHGLHFAATEPPTSPVTRRRKVLQPPSPERGASFRWKDWSSLKRTSLLRGATFKSTDDEARASKGRWFGGLLSGSRRRRSSSPQALSSVAESGSGALSELDLVSPRPASSSRGSADSVPRTSHDEQHHADGPSSPSSPTPANR